MNAEMNNAAKVKSIVSTVLLVLLAVFAAMLILPRVFGLSPYAVLSSSMEPKYRTGSLIFVEKVKPEDVRVGDAITFVYNEELTVVTHKVVAIDTVNKLFTTKGIANDANDPGGVRFENLIGIPRFSLPALGYVSVWLNTTAGRIIAAVIVAAMLIVAFLPGSRKSRKNQVKN